MLASVKLSTVLSVAVLLGSQLAQAAEFQMRDPEFSPRTWACRYDGQNVPLGARRCLRTPQGEGNAECVVAINMSSWRQDADDCN